MLASDTYPGINAGSFMWKDAERRHHRMEDMPLSYLKNVKKCLEDMKYYENLEDRPQLLEKIAELDKAIHVVTAESRLAKLSPSLTEKASARDFDIHDLARA